ncbi:MAG TPA: CAP domain-containing protein [Chitinophagaceae bacterium]|jgi:uncharacterized protein YkwD|nr:CAP domain-containing protein [Chitinophagaceae bacterium]
MPGILSKISLLLIFGLGFQNSPDAARTDSLVSDIYKYVNEDRQAKGLALLKMNELESSLATRHSRDMASGKVKFGHDGFSTRARTIQKELGSREVGENVASGQMTAREVVDGWLKSPGHKKNIEGNFTLTGIGYARDKKGDIYFTQIFSR